MKHIKLFEDFGDENLTDEDVLSKEEIQIADEAIKEIGQQKLEDRGDVRTVISDIMKRRHTEKYPSADDYMLAMHNMCSYVATKLKLDLYDDVQTVEDFEDGEKKKAVVGNKWSVHYAAPGTGSTEYKVEKIENGKVYSKTTKDTGRELEISDVI